MDLVCFVNELFKLLHQLTVINMKRCHIIINMKTIRRDGYKCLEALLNAGFTTNKTAQIKQSVRQAGQDTPEMTEAD